MRPIKFRAWDKEDEVMIDWFWLSSEGDLYESPVTLYDTPHSEIERNDDLILMQYTGLEDKNGVDIYEGDILYVEQQSRGTIDQFIPHKRSVAVRYEAKDTAYVFDEEHGQAIGLYTITDELEVIGNIYENSELLEEEHAKN